MKLAIPIFVIPLCYEEAFIETNEGLILFLYWFVGGRIVKEAIMEVFMEVFALLIVPIVYGVLF